MLAAPPTTINTPNHISDVADMDRAQDPALSAQMQLLWVGNNEKGFDYVRDVLTRSGEGGVGLERVRSPEEALQRLNQTTYDLVLCDYKSGDGMALRLLHEIRKEGPRDRPFGRRSGTRLQQSPHGYQCVCGIDVRFIGARTSSSPQRPGDYGGITAGSGTHPSIACLWT